MLALKEKLSLIDSLVEPGSKIAFFGYPTYLNIGDLLILEGTERFFACRNYSVTHRFSDKLCQELIPRNKLPELPAGTTLLLQGGGNFGDLYGSHQPSRQAVVERYPNHRVVLLPQTAYFQEPQILQASANLFRKHPDLHLLARDPKTAELFMDFSPNVYLCPDMAHMLWDFFPRNFKTDGGTLFLLRADTEAADWQQELDCPEKLDWPDLCTDRERSFSKKRIKRFEELNAQARWPWLPTLWLWRRCYRKVVARAVQRFLRHESVFTSRLHGHLLACLLGMSNTLLDNSYGKNRSYFQHWTRTVPGTQFLAP